MLHGERQVVLVRLATCSRVRVRVGLRVGVRVGFRLKVKVGISVRVWEHGAMFVSARVVYLLEVLARRRVRVIEAEHVANLLRVGVRGVGVEREGERGGGDRGFGASARMGGRDGWKGG